MLQPGDGRIIFSHLKWGELLKRIKRLDLVKIKRARIKIQPRFKIQYPMKNRCKYKGSQHIKQYPKEGIVI